MRSERSEALVERLGASGDFRVWRAPGRVNLIGEHVDYLGGLVLPFACDREVLLACEPLEGALALTSLEEPGAVRIDLSGGEPPPGWGRYAWGVVAALREAGVAANGVRGIVSSTVPVGAGLSSSAALAAAIALALTEGRRVDPAVLQRAEHLAVGVPCGPMDQAAVLGGRAGHAILVDCRSGRRTDVALPPELGSVVVDTGTRRRLRDGRYAERRAEVERALRASGGTLDDVELDTAERRLDAVAFRRLRHAVGEQRRVREAVEAIRGGDLDALGRLVVASHHSLRDDFEVSAPALDVAVDTLVGLPDVFGARLVGAGFAGCVLALVRAGAEDAVAAAVRGVLAPRLPTLDVFAVRAVDGAGAA